jgi:hypothetical protein
MIASEPAANEPLTEGSTSAIADGLAGPLALAPLNPADIRIDEEFRLLMPPLAPAEIAALQAKLLREGCLDELTVWAGHNVLLDGHHRLSICTAHGTPFRVRAIKMPDRQAALDWISEHQRERRNLSRAGRSYTRGKHYLAEKLGTGRPASTKNTRDSANGKSGHHDHFSGGGKGGQNGAGPDASKSGQMDHFDPDADGHALKTAQRLGKYYGVGERTIRRDRDFALAVDALTAHCGDIARELSLVTGAPLMPMDVERLVLLAPEEQRGLLDLVREHGRAALPWTGTKRTTFSVPVDPVQMPRAIVDRLGAANAAMVREGLTQILVQEAGRSSAGAVRISEE